MTDFVYDIDDTIMVRVAFDYLQKGITHLTQAIYAKPFWASECLLES